MGGAPPGGRNAIANRVGSNELMKRNALIKVLNQTLILLLSVVSFCKKMLLKYILISVLSLRPFQANLVYRGSRSTIPAGGGGVF